MPVVQPRLKNVLRNLSQSGQRRGHRAWTITVRFCHWQLAQANKYCSISCRFWDIQCRKMSWPWNQGQRSLKVIGTDTYRSAAYDFLLTFHSNHGPISYRFRDRRRFLSKPYSACWRAIKTGILAFQLRGNAEKLNCSPYMFILAMLITWINLFNLLKFFLFIYFFTHLLITLRQLLAISCD